MDEFDEDGDNVALDANNQYSSVNSLVFNFQTLLNASDEIMKKRLVVNFKLHVSHSKNRIMCVRLCMCFFT